MSMLPNNDVACGSRTAPSPTGPCRWGRHHLWIPYSRGDSTLLRQSGSRRAPYQLGRPRNPIGHWAPQPSRPVPSGGGHYV